MQAVNIMEKIYISFWSGGQAYSRYDKSIDLFFLINFITLFKKYNPDLKLVMLCDLNISQSIPARIKNLLEIHIILDKYNNYPPELWPMVKVLAISEIEDKEVFHLDFDIVWKYDIRNLFNYIRQHKIDALYQSYESLAMKHKYYSEYLKKTPEVMKLLLHAQKKTAYNAGVSYFSAKAKPLLKTIVDHYKANVLTFADNVALEQMIIPNELIKRGLNVQVLCDHVSKLPLNANNKRFTQSIGAFDSELFTGLNTTGTFINSISYFHFLGTVKRKEKVMEAVNYLSSD